MSKLQSKQKVKIFGFIALFIVICVLSVIYLSHKNIAILNPAGPIARRERSLIYFAMALSLLVILPVFSLTFYIALHYREGNTEAKYTPDWDHSKYLEGLWWAIPSVLILILAIVTWKSTYSLNPYTPIATKGPTLNIQVVALQWKWLFIYPDSDMATVNYLEIPDNIPVNFQITSDAPMNSFWIPQLGGQIYAMPGMNTQLNLMASRTGNFNGFSANISGSGFARMNFMAHSVSLSDYKSWVKQVKASPLELSSSEYKNLTKPSYGNSVFYSSVQNKLYYNVIDKYMGMGTNSMSGMSMGMGS